MQGVQLAGILSNAYYYQAIVEKSHHLYNPYIHNHLLSSVRFPVLRVSVAEIFNNRWMHGRSKGKKVKRLRGK